MADNYIYEGDAIMILAHVRRARCEAIAVRARAKGLDASWQKVNRNYRIWIRWDEGRLATGYLMRQTGVRRLQP